MKVNHDIYRNATQKLMRRKELEDYIDVCLEAKICPECGEDLNTRGEGTSHPPVTFFNCSKCQFSWKGTRPLGKVKIQDVLTSKATREPVMEQKFSELGSTIQLPPAKEKVKRENSNEIND